MIKILIADDQELIRQSLAIVLGAVPDFVITDAVEDGAQVLESVRTNRPDVILMDIRMPKMDGIQATRAVKEKYPAVKIIILTTFDDEEYVYGAVRDGASGYLLKGTSIDRLSEAIRKVHEGGVMLNADILSKLMVLFSKIARSNLTVQAETAGVEELGQLERKIIRLVGQGFSTKEIAETLYLSQGTVRNYLSTILNKRNLRDRTQLAIWAVQTGVAAEEIQGDGRD